jgi:hypothetical protein
MFEGLKRLFRSITAGSDGAADSSRPQRVNPDPPKDEWFSRVRARSAAARRDARARASAEAKKLERLDGEPLALGREAETQIDALFARATDTSAGR